MTRRATFTDAEMRRAIKAARKLDKNAVVEFMTPAGFIRILPPDAPIPAPEKQDYDAWRAKREGKVAGRS